MTIEDEDNLGTLVELVEKDPRFAEERAIYDFIQHVVAGLKEMRRRSSLTQKQIAKRLGVSQGRISQIESGLLDYAPNLETVAKYARACNETVSIEFPGAAAAGELEPIKDVYLRSEYETR